VVVERFFGVVAVLSIYVELGAHLSAPSPTDAPRGAGEQRNHDHRRDQDGRKYRADDDAADDGDQHPPVLQEVERLPP
jgi:hypothetical protein